MKLIRLANTIPPIHTQVSDEDYEWLLQYEWRLSRGYARRSTTVDRRIIPDNRGTGDRIVGIQMGKEILKRGMGVDMKGLVCDHIDRVKLNNQRSNLRPATAAQNRMNSEKDYRAGASSRYKGVFLYKGKWVSQGVSSGKRIRLGTFKLEEDAARAYNAFAKEAHGEFAKLNDVPDVPNAPMPDAPIAKAALTARSSPNAISGYRGVSRSRNGRRWSASGVWNGRRRYFGTFATPQMAAAAYNRFAKTRVTE